MSFSVITLFKDYLKLLITTSVVLTQTTLTVNERCMFLQATL